VLQARVNYATHRARVAFDPARVDLARVLDRIRAAGYQPKPWSDTVQATARRAETKDLLVRLGTAAFLSSQLTIYQAALYAGYFQGIDAGTRRGMEVISLALALPVYLYSGAPFLEATWRGLRRLSFGMDALVAIGAGAALVASALLVRPPARVTWAIAAIATLAAAAAVPLLGHAAGSTSRLILHTAHILGAGLWLGTLGVLVLVPGPAEDRFALLRSFSPIALTGAALVLPTGLVAAWIYLGSLPALWTTAYGRALLMKVALVAAIVACGYWNWQRFRRERYVEAAVSPADHGGPDGPPALPFATLAVLEAVIALTVVLVTSWLTELAHP